MWSGLVDEDDDHADDEEDEEKDAPSSTGVGLIPSMSTSTTVTFS